MMWNRKSIILQSKNFIRSRKSQEEGEKGNLKVFHKKNIKLRKYFEGIKTEKEIHFFGSWILIFKNIALLYQNQKHSLYTL
jgi:hypothetical protein